MRFFGVLWGFGVVLQGFCDVQAFGFRVVLSFGGFHRAFGVLGHFRVVTVIGAL